MLLVHVQILASGNKAVIFRVGVFSLAIGGRLKGVHFFSIIISGDNIYLFNKIVGWLWSHCISKGDTYMALRTASQYQPDFLLPFLVGLEIHLVSAYGCCLSLMISLSSGLLLEPRGERPIFGSGEQWLAWPSWQKSGIFESGGLVGLLLQGL